MALRALCLAEGSGSPVQFCTAKSVPQADVKVQKQAWSDVYEARQQVSL